MKSKKPILCLDFDGVLHSYSSGWKGTANIPDPPVSGAGAFILDAMQSFTVAVHSSRSRSLRGRAAMRRYIEAMLIDAYYEANALFWLAWKATGHSEPENTPWTHGGDREIVLDLCGCIQWPWFKPSAFITIDDRAITFTGKWPPMQALLEFKPWNKK